MNKMIWFLLRKMIIIESDEYLVELLEKSGT